MKSCVTHVLAKTNDSQVVCQPCASQNQRQHGSATQNTRNMQYSSVVGISLGLAQLQIGA